MNAQQLKNSILQEAIEGRLVPQDPNDEPASVLLKRIRKEKERLVKEGKLKKKDLIETPIQEDEIPFEIPENWEWVRLGDIVSFIGGYAYDSSSFISNSENQVLRLGNVKNDNILLNVNPVFIDDKLALDTEKFKCKENDILITMTGTRKKRDYFFSVLINSNYLNLFINQRVGCLRSIIGNVSRWLVVALKTEVILTDVFQYETGTANQGNLGAENILKVKIPLPPLAEQKRIVAKIEELLPKVEEYGKAQDALDKLNAELPERLKKSILQEAIEGRLVKQDPNDEPASVLLDKIRAEKAKLVKEGKLKKKDLIETPISEDEIPFEIPESWEWVRLPDISANSLGKTLNGGKTIGATKKYLCSINVYWNRIDLLKVKETPFDESDCQKYKLEKGDLLICEGGDYGRSAVWDKDEEMYYQNALHRIKFYNMINPYFYMYCMEVFKSISLLEEVAKGMTIKHLTQDALYSLVFPLPPLSEQHRIVEKLEQLMAEIDKLKA